MHKFTDIKVVLLDIEGTTSKSSHVYDVLFPYAFERIPAWIASHPGQLLEEIRSQSAQLVGVTELENSQLADVLKQWISDDIKATPLKTIQGQIWSDGFEKGELSSHLFDDVRPEIEKWVLAGKQICIFSSGSVPAQMSWFKHAPGGSLSQLISGYFDTQTAGPKKESNSYLSIAAQLEIAPNQILFFSDVTEELIAAREAGFQTVGVTREFEPHWSENSDEFIWINNFDEVELA